MAPYNHFVDKVVATAFLFALFNVNEGHCFFYQQPAITRPQGHQQPLYDYHEPPNRVGYGFKPSWAEVHLQPLAEESPQYQQVRYQQAQYQPEQPVEKSAFQPQPQQEISQPQYTLPAHTYLQPLEKYQISPPKYQWAVQPSVKYNFPTISNPLTYRDPQQHVNVLVPLRVFGVQSFPPFLERLIQRVQTYYSIYNPPETLTVPYSVNTPPTFPASSLLPAGGTFISPDDESNIVNAEIPNFGTNSVDTNEGVTETSITPTADGSIANEIGDSATERSKVEDAPKEELTEATTGATISEDTSSATSSDTDGDKGETNDSSASNNSETNPSEDSPKIDGDDKNEAPTESDNSKSDSSSNENKSNDESSETTGNPANETTDAPSSDETSKSDDVEKIETTTAVSASESDSSVTDSSDADKES